MTTSNRDRVGETLTTVRDGLLPYVLRELKAAYGVDWAKRAEQSLIGRASWRASDPNIDTQAVLSLMMGHWDEVFRSKLGPFERTLVHELNNTRNRWAHEEPFSTDDAYRALDSAVRLLSATGAAREAATIEKEKQELLRTRFDEQALREKRKAVTLPLEGQPAAGLRPWREVVTPHPDVMSGRYQKAEFAADLGQVHRGEGSVEYRDPVEFFRRTFITEGLKGLLVNGLKRLSGMGGDPVMDLQTNFGGGKTHSMLALYHLVGGHATANELAGVPELLAEAGLAELPTARRAVLVGIELSPTQPRVKADGTTVRTLWGEMAWQLGGKDAYDLVRPDDEAGTSPGSVALRELFELHAPCLVLVDEWVAYARQLYGNDGLPGGSFDANTLNFAQALSEAAKNAPQTFVVVSIPASNVEVGGDGGQTALQHLKNTIIRTAQPWRPASADEGFEIVRRRLFQPIADPKDYAARDAAAKSFAELYRKQTADFPDRCREPGYEARIKSAYPIHPELFDRLYGDWSTLERFQRTRGVLRLMAEVVHTLWEDNDNGTIILPASLPLYEATVQSQLTHFLEDRWVPVIDTDIDGPSSIPWQLESADPSMKRLSACRRVARTIFLGAAPTLRTGHRGISDRDIKLGCAQPGETVAVFGDALRRLTDDATHLYVDGNRYWFDTQPSISRTARERSANLGAADVFQFIRERLKAEERRDRRGDFPYVHACPASHADVPDDQEARLVILGPETTSTSNVDASEARVQAAEYLVKHGTGPRSNQNAIIFLAADKLRLGALEQSVRQFLAWKSIEDEKDSLNLDPFQSKQAESKRKQAEDAVKQQIPDAFCWLLVPSQVAGQSTVEWSQARLQSGDGLAVRASKRLIQDDGRFVNMGPQNLRNELDRIPLWRGDHVALRQLWEDFPRYLYLPRLKDSEILTNSIREGAGRMMWETESFALADGWDDTRQRYIGLKAGQVGNVLIDGTTLLVRPEVARRQMDAEAAPVSPAAGSVPTTPPVPHPGGAAAVVPAAAQSPAPRLKRRFHGSVRLNELKVATDADSIAREVIRHLTNLVGAGVTIRLEIEAVVPDGFPDEVVRIVSENAAVLKFEPHAFEEE